MANRNRTNNDLQNTTQKTKDRATRTCNNNKNCNNEEGTGNRGNEF